MTNLQTLVQSELSALSPEFDVPLAPLSYFRIGGNAEVFLKLDSRQKIIDVVKFCAAHQLPFRILAGASNVLISSAGLPGITLSISNEEYQQKPVSETESVVTVGSGYRTALLVRKTIDDGLAGLEYFLGVPGKIGGAVYNNAHYQNHLLGDLVQRVECISLSGEVRWYSQLEAEFRYDYSRFQQSKEVILQIEVLLKKGDRDESMKLVRESTIHRANSQPLGEPSSGCYFQNVPNTPELQQLFPQFSSRKEFPSAFLIDQAGLKGARVGDIEVSQKHAAFFVNTGNGTSDQVKLLAEKVKETVQKKYGVTLKEEVFFME